jgi:hypothetical protein
LRLLGRGGGARECRGERRRPARAAQNEGQKQKGAAACRVLSGVACCQHGAETRLFSKINLPTSLDARAAVMQAGGGYDGVQPPQRRRGAAGARRGRSARAIRGTLSASPDRGQRGGRGGAAGGRARVPAKRGNWCVQGRRAVGVHRPAARGGGDAGAARSRRGRARARTERGAERKRPAAGPRCRRRLAPAARRLRRRGREMRIDRAGGDGECVCVWCAAAAIVAFSHFTFS